MIPQSAPSYARFAWVLPSDMTSCVVPVVRMLAFGAVMLGAAGSAFGQAITGTLVDQNTGQPVGGAYIVLLQEDSTEVARSLTSGLGEFAIHAPRSGTYFLRTEVVGYRTSVTESFVVAAADVDLADLQVSAIRLRLDPLFIDGRARECRVIGEQALEVLTVWDETRKALQAVAWSELQQEFIHDLDRFERSYSTSFVLRREHRRNMNTRNVMPFRSRTVQELERDGYVVIEDDSVVYDAPDAEVFFSAPFLQNHCFWLERRGSGAGARLGLNFEPVSDSDRADVSGVFWLDANNGALQQLEISYVNVGEWQRERGAGAELRFHQLPDGRWFVERWWIRMPMVRSVESLKGPIWDFPEAVVGFEEEGGEVMKVYAPDGRTVFARDRATVTGVVVDSTTGLGLEGALVTLAGTDWITVSQADGRFWLTDLPQGRYQLTFTHPRAAFFGLSDAWSVRLREGGETYAEVAIPSVGLIAERRCGARGGDVGLLIGYVTDETTDAAVVDADVQIKWLEGGDDINAMRVLDVQSDSIGVYRACVPRGAPLSVEVNLDGELVTAVPAVFDEEPLQVLDIRVARPGRGLR